MAKSFDLDHIKQRSIKFKQIWHKKLANLSDSVARSGKEGISHWLKSHHQIEELEAAIEDLLIASELDDFTLLQVETTLSSFVLPAEDLGQAEWYKTAHQYLIEFERCLTDDQTFDIKKLQAAQNELKFISQSNEFHQRYKIESIQKKVFKVYQSLQQVINDYKEIEKEKIQATKEQGKLKLAQIEADKAQSEAKKAMIGNIKIKEKRIAIVEEKKRLIAAKVLAESQENQQREGFEIQAKQAEIERKAKLQDSYLELQFEEKLAGWKLQDYIEKMTFKLNHENINQEQKLALNVFTEFLKLKG